MNFDLFQITFLAVIQGITEYLPISSSGHLIIPSALFGWQDQGLVFDVAVHVGSLFAVVLYFRTQLASLTDAWVRHVVLRQSSEQAKLAWLLIMATIPAGVAGLVMNDIVDRYARSILIVGTTSILFGILLYLSDRTANKNKTLSDIDWKTALFIGLAQVLALIPGTSRSGVTMTAGLFVRLSRHAASQFSFLLAIPIIAASGLLKITEFFRLGASSAEWLMMLYGILVSGVVSYLCIHYFLQLIERIGFFPFFIYRLALGIVLLSLYFL